MVMESVNGLTWLRKQIETADADLVREMVKVFAEALMGAEADSLCGADYGEVSPDRVKWVPDPALGQPGGHHGACDPQAEKGQLFPGLASLPPTPVGGQPGTGGDRVLRTGGFHPQGRRAGAGHGPGGHFQVPGF